jgi:protein-tyrosine phosphatase
MIGLRTAAALALLAAAAPLPLAARPASAVHAAAHQRFILLEGGRNFRDIGGWRTASGQTVRWGRLYRSGSLGRLTPAGQSRLEGLRIAAIVDLRSSEERASDSNARLAAARMGYWTRDYAFGSSDVVSRLRNPANHSAGRVRAIMLDAYRAFPREQAPSYRELFARLAAGKGPVVVNCSAGKDRTGLAAALVLTAIGVPYGSVRRDFLLSNGAPGMDTLGAAMNGLLPAVAQGPLLGVEPAYLDAAFMQIRRDYGSVDTYLDRELGVNARVRQQLRVNLLH